MNKFLAIFSGVFLAFSLAGQSISFESSIDTNRILIGEQTNFHLTAKNITDPNAVVWPVWPDTLRGIEVLRVSSDTSKENELFTLHQHYLITSFDSGFVLIPPFSLLLDTLKLETEPQILNVSTVELDPTQDYYDIKSPVKAPIDWVYWLKRIWLFAALAAVVLAIVLWLWLRKRKAKKEVVFVDTRTPAQRAKENLQALLEARVWQAGDVKGYYSQCTDIIRTYMEETLFIPAMEMTTDELLDALAGKTSYEVTQLLAEALQQADLVKFAKAQPGPDMHERVWNNCMRIVELTEPREEDTDDA
jgi:hypothetical protein